MRAKGGWELSRKRKKAKKNIVKKEIDRKDQNDNSHNNLKPLFEAKNYYYYYTEILSNRFRV